MMIKEHYKNTELWAWLETFLGTLLALAIGFGVNPAEPFFVGTEFPWLWLAPVLLSLRYGVLPGIFSSVMLLLAWLAYYQIQPVHAVEFPKIYFFGGLILVMICGEYSDIWHGRLRRLNEANRYLDERLGRITKRHHLLRLSHDRLEQELLSRPATLRDTLDALRALALEPSEAEALPAARDLLLLLAQYCQIESAALYTTHPDGGHLQEVARVGNPPPLSPGDPMLQHTLETSALTHIQSPGVHHLADTPFVVIAPLKNSNLELLGVLAIHQMPFFALNHDTLQLLSVMQGYYADSISQLPELRLIHRHYADCPPEFAEELVKLDGLARRAGVVSHLVTLTFLPNDERDDMVELIKRMKRTLDISWIAARGDHIIHVNLMPLSGGTAVEGYLNRIDALIKQHFGHTLENADIRFHNEPLGQKSVMAALERAAGHA